MADNLPLIPEKLGAMCTDVRPVLREAFRELDYLPPLVGARGAGDEDGTRGNVPRGEPWVATFEAQLAELRQRESALRAQRAARLARDALPNIHALQPPAPAPAARDNSSASGVDMVLLDRQDLMPSIVQDAGRCGSLWVRNILTRSSGELGGGQGCPRRPPQPVRLSSAEVASLQSVSVTHSPLRSVGALVPAAPRAPLLASTTPPLPEYVVPMPRQIVFVNFTVGQPESRVIRLMNVSKFECRLSLRPPTRRELDLELCGPRGLTLTAGGTTTLKIHFRARDELALYDELAVNVSLGRSLRVPICAYMESPILEILVPAPAMFSSAMAAGGGTGTDVLDLGARLLGAPHDVPARLHCAAPHASFFLLTEDAWHTLDLDALTSIGSLLVPPFSVRPAWWRGGGGAVHARLGCRATAPGLHAAALHVLCSTGVVRCLHLLADALLFHPDHVTLEGHAKDYDIQSEDDPACQYYVHLGTAFPHAALTASVQLYNNSPVMYNYYWSMRPWGVCSCWEEARASGVGAVGAAGSEPASEDLCEGAQEARDLNQAGRRSGHRDAAVYSAGLVRVEPARGCLVPRSSRTVHVCAPDVGDRLGTQRAVLMLILEDIPIESFPQEYQPNILTTETIKCEPIPGFKGERTREVCSVVCAQLEVWWEVVPARFVLHPPALPLPHSRRVRSVDMVVRATQLSGCSGLSGEWVAPAPPGAPPRVHLSALHSCAVSLCYPLPAPPTAEPETDVITLKCTEYSWSSSCVVRRACSERHPALQPALQWLGVRAPDALLRAHCTLTNDTHQHIYWWATAYRYLGENPPSLACGGGAGAAAGAARECPECREEACTCALLRPTRGALHHNETVTLKYQVNAPRRDGCVCTLVAAQRTRADVARMAGGAGVAARAALLFYRVLAPRLLLRVLPCRGDHHSTGPCAGCVLDGRECSSGGGAAVLRPRAALQVARAMCSRLHVTNITPIPTVLVWDPPLDDKVLNVSIIPKERPVPAFETVEFQVVVEGRRVCGRRVFVQRARALHAYKPLYLLIDVAVADVFQGLEVVYEIPLGDSETAMTDSTLVLRRLQREQFPWDTARHPPAAARPQELFEWEDRKRALRLEAVCRCPSRMVYVPPPRPPPLPPPTSTTAERTPRPPIEIVDTPPRLSRVCACCARARPVLPLHAHAPALQFRNMPLNTVRTRIIRLRNESLQNARWSATLRRYAAAPAARAATALSKEWFAECVQFPGVLAEVVRLGAGGAGCARGCSAGVLAPHASLALQLRLYADCWGLYHNQLLIQVTGVEPLVLDVWAEAVGSPLQFALAPPPNRESGEPAAALLEDMPLQLWMSASDAQRALVARNTSRCELEVHAYMLTEHEHESAALPFRLYYRLVDVPPPVCPCLYLPLSSESEESRSRSSGTGAEAEAASCEEDMDTGVELFLGPDYGYQAESCFKVWPASCRVAGGARVAWRLQLSPPPHGELAPAAAVLLRTLPLHRAGRGWARGEPSARRVRLQQTARAARLAASAPELRVRLCALHLPADSELRVRKRFRVRNVGTGALRAAARCREPWALLQEAGGSGCVDHVARHRLQLVEIHMQPRSSLEMCVEVNVKTWAAWAGRGAAAAAGAATAPLAPSAPPPFSQWERTCTHLRFYDDDNVLLSVPLHLELEFPALVLTPALLDLGPVTDGDSRKSYFTLQHSSQTETIEVQVEWVGGGGGEFSVWPRAVALHPGAPQRLYVLYTARWGGAPVEGCVVARARGGAGAWCAARARARAHPLRDMDRNLQPHDHTDDAHLMPH